MHNNNANSSININIGNAHNIPTKPEHSVTILLHSTNLTNQGLLDAESITTQITETPITEQLKIFEILPNLYLSKFPTQIPQEIMHVLNMCTQPHPPNTTRAYLHISLDDIDNIKPHIQQILGYVDTALRNNGKVLVHYALGINRSAAAIVSYLCHGNQINSSDALGFLRERKQNVKPSALFLKQIDQFFHWEEERKKTPLSVSIDDYNRESRRHW
jgi:protein-tyrosine phosphatase